MKRSIVLMVLMCCAALGAFALKPTKLLSDILPKMDLEVAIPAEFGQWRQDTRSSVVIANPQQVELLSKIYNQTLARTYTDSGGYRVMLSIAYGGDQSDALQLHRPEVCYPAQGFQLEASSSAVINVGAASVPVVRINTRQGSRLEKVTYWTLVGDQIVDSGLQKKWIEMAYGADGLIPDGILFRVSSIDADAENAYRRQEGFVQTLMANVDPALHVRFVGATKP